MKKKIFVLLILCVMEVGSIIANVKIGDLYYKLNTKDKTATLTYEKYNSEFNYDRLEEAVIPASIFHNGVDYKVTSIGYCAFCHCSSLLNVVIPSSVIDIQDYAFTKCTNLRTLTLSDGLLSIGVAAFEHSNISSVIIPTSVTKIDDYAFAFCYELKSIIIPQALDKIGKRAFQDCYKLYVYTPFPIDSKTGIPSNRVTKLKLSQMAEYSPYSLYAKEFVEQGINEWQKKGEFERTADWQQRVTEQTRKEQIDVLLGEAEQKYISSHIQNRHFDLILGQYDADNEVFAMTDLKNEPIYIAVPLEEAKDFKANWNHKKITPQMQILNDQIKLSGLTITMPNGKEYTYRNTDAVNYNLAEVEYNFEPIELDIPQHTAAPQGERNITTTKVQIGISQVDKEIPTTDASNPNTFVIIFANEDYKNVASVPFAKNDGSVFQKYCQKTLGIPASNIHYVENASFNDIRIQLAWLRDVCNAYEGRASVIVYYAGHGIPDEATKSAYLLPVDGDGRYVQSAYNIDELYQKLGAMKAKTVTIFMDACFSGSKREEGMLASTRGVALKVKSGVPQGNMVVFSAATGDETAYPNNDEQHGMFTYYLLKKLQETKGDVTLQDLGNYITTNVRQQSIVKNGKSQTPCVTPSVTLDASWRNWKLK